MSDGKTIYQGKFNSSENYLTPNLNPIDLSIEMQETRLVVYLTDQDGSRREVTIETSGENNEQIQLMVHGPYNAAAPDGADDEPRFLAKVGADRSYAYDNYSGSGGRVGKAYAKISDDGIELTDTMEFPNEAVGPKL